MQEPGPCRRQRGRVVAPVSAAPAPVALIRLKLAVGSRGWMEAPVPGLVDDAVRVVARIAHAEAKTSGVGLQPGERRGGLERFLGRRLARGADVQGAAVVVLAVARRGVDREDPGHALPARQPPFEEAPLEVVAAVAVA